jgi:hypothetical protein
MAALFLGRARLWLRTATAGATARRRRGRVLRPAANHHLYDLHPHPAPILRDSTCPILRHSLRGCVYSATAAAIQTSPGRTTLALVRSTTRNSSTRRF